MIDSRETLAWDMKALLKGRKCVTCVCALHAGPDMFFPAEPVARLRRELGWMKINRSAAGRREEV